MLSTMRSILIRDCTSIKNIYVAYMSSSQIFVYIISTNTIVHMANFRVIHHVQLNCTLYV